MAQRYNVNSNAVANAVRGIFSTGDEAGAAERRALLNEDLLAERILEARRKRQAAEEAARLGTPEAIESRLPLETGASAAQVRNVLQAIPAGDVPQVPGTEVTPDQAGPRMPIDSAIVERVRRVAAEQFNPLARTHPQRVASATKTRNEDERTAQNVRDAMTGNVPRDVLNARIAAGQGQPYKPWSGTTGQAFDTGTGRFGPSVSDKNVSEQGLLIARGATEQARQKRLAAQADADRASAEQRRSRLGFPPPRPGAKGDPKAEERRDITAAYREGRAQGLSGDRLEGFVDDWMGGAENRPRKRSEPLPGESPKSGYQAQLDARPKLKGMKLGSYERGKGYVILSGKKATGMHAVFDDDGNLTGIRKE